MTVDGVGHGFSTELSSTTIRDAAFVDFTVSSGPLGDLFLGGTGSRKHSLKVGTVLPATNSKKTCLSTHIFSRFAEKTRKIMSLNFRVHQKMPTNVQKPTVRTCYRLATSKFRQMSATVSLWTLTHIKSVPKL